MMKAPKLRFKEFSDEWEAYQLADFSETITSGSRDWAKYYSDNGDKFIRMTNLSRDGIALNLNDLKFVKLPEHSTEGTRSSLKYGDILISITAELGKLGWIPENFGNAYINQHTALVRLNNNVNSKFIAYLLSTVKYNLKINGLNDSGAKAGLNLSTIKKLQIEIPPKPEQTKIAAFLTAVDDKIAQLTEQKQLLTQYKKGVMQKIFNQEIRFKDDNGEDFGAWEEKKLAEIAYSTTGASNREDSLENEGQYTFFDRSEDIRTSNKFLFDCEALIVGGEGSIFKPKYFVGKFDLHQRAYAIMNFKSAIAKYLFYFMEFNHQYFLSVAVGTTVKSLRLPMFDNMPVKLPSIKEQTKIANFLTELDNKIDNITEQLTQAKEWKKGLLQQMFV